MAARPGQGWQVGEVVAEKFTLVGRIGEGGMGHVWRATHAQLGGAVALKCLDARVAETPTARARFLREARAAAALRSPYVIQVFDYGVDGDLPFIAMELLEGETLAERVQRGPLPAELTLRVLEHVARAMTKAHEVKLVHRDLKPANVFLVDAGADGGSEEWTAKVLDFGIAKQLDPSLLDSTEPPSTEEGVSIGTPQYMSPEQIRAQPCDHRTDLWAMGVIAYECVTGKRLFATRSYADLVFAICHDPLPKTAGTEHGGEAFDRWLERALARDPERRFQSARELVDALTPVLGLAGSDPAQLPHPATGGLDSPPPQDTSGGRGFYPALAVVVVALAGAFWLWRTRAGNATLPPSPALSAPLRSAGAATAMPPPPAESPLIPKVQQVSFSGAAQSPALSGDGKTLYYLTDEGGEAQLHRRSLIDNQDSVVLRRGEVRSITVSDDGNTVLLMGSSKSPSAMWKTDGSLVELPVHGSSALGPDQQTIAFIDSSTDKVVSVQAPTGGTKTIPVGGDYQWMWGLHWAEKANRLVVETADAGHQRQLWSVPADGGPTTRILAEVREWDMAAVADDAVFFVTRPSPSSDLVRVPFDHRRGLPTGPARVIVSGIRAESLSVSSDGSRVAYGRVSTRANLWRTSLRKDSERTQLTKGTGSDRSPRVSPDGERIAFIHVAEQAEVLLTEMKGGPTTPVPLAGLEPVAIDWSPSGDSLAVLGVRGGQRSERELGVVSLAGGDYRAIAPAPALGEFSGDEDAWVTPLTWADDGKILVRLAGNRNYGVVDPATGSARRLFQLVGGLDSPPMRSAPPQLEDGWSFCPQGAGAGSYVLYRHTPQPFPNSPFGVWLVPTEGAPTRVAEGMLLPVRRGADGHIWIAETDFRAKPIGVFEAALDGARPATLTKRATLDFSPSWVSALDLSRDGERVVVGVEERESDVWLLELPR
ncbi:MAG: protein kinase [Polyangiaceae bacterium]